MATLLVGDIHGCYDELMRLLDKASFDEHRDELWLTGDLVARGKHSLAVLRQIYKLRSSVKLVLGNHDLHLLAIHEGISVAKPKDKLDKLLKADDRDELLYWLRSQPLLQYSESLNLVMTHAGITPQWDLPTALNCAKEVSDVLTSDSYQQFLTDMYANTPNSWNSETTGIERLRFITNALTRMRFCFGHGELDFLCKESPKNAPKALRPWFEIPRKVSDDLVIAFGHWAALAGKTNLPNLLALDTGCVWGGALTLYKWEDKALYSVICKKR